MIHFSVNDKVKILKYKGYLNSGVYLKFSLKTSEGKIGIILAGPKNDSYQVKIDTFIMWVPDCLLELVEHTSEWMSLKEAKLP